MKKSFSGKLVIKNIEPITDQTWKIVANFIDNTGTYFADDVQINDIIYFYMPKENIKYKAYNVTKIDESTNKSNFVVFVKHTFNTTTFVPEISSSFIIRDIEDINNLCVDLVDDNLLIEVANS